MDVPNVNWDVLKPLGEYREEKKYPGIMNIRSCSSDIAFGALQTRIGSQKWELQKIFREIVDLKSHQQKLMTKLPNCKI